MLSIYPVSISIIRSLQPVLVALGHADPHLADQLRRAATSVALNIAEGSGSRGKLRAARYHTALGSARECLACLEIAVALGYTAPPSGELLAGFDRVIGTLVRLVRPG